MTRSKSIIFLAFITKEGLEYQVNQKSRLFVIRCCSYLKFLSSNIRITSQHSGRLACNFAIIPAPLS